MSAFWLLPPPARASGGPTPDSVLSTPPDGVFPRTITHEAGQTLLSQAPQRVAVLSTGQVDGLLTLGVVPVGATRDDRGSPLPGYLRQVFARQQAAFAQVQDLGTRNAPDLEALAALAPDLILVNRAATAPAVLRQYQRIAPVVLTRGRGEHWRADFLLLADALGKRQQAQAWMAAFQRDARAFAQAWAAAGGAPQVSFVQAGGGRIRLMGLRSFVGDIAQGMGLARPPGQRFARTSQDIGAERLDLADGDWLFYGARGDGVRVFTASPLWRHLGAVAAGHTRRVDYDAFYMNAGPSAARIVMATLAAALSPAAAA